MGLGRLLWRNLVPHGFNYVASCTNSGKIDRDTEKEVAKKLAKVIATFERWGFIYIGVSIGIQLVWLVPLAMFASQIATLSTH